MIIYKITNLVNGKMYIGQTIRDIQTRLFEHKKYARNGENYPIHLAIRKYGESNFSIEKICECVNNESLDRMEKFFIKRFNTIENGYNIQPGGNGGAQSEDGRRRIGEHQRKRKRTKKEKLKIAKTLTGRPLPEKLLPHLKKKGNIPWNKGLKASEKEVKRLTEANHKYFGSEKNKKRFKKIMKKAMSKEEVRKQLSDKTKAYQKANPDWVKNLRNKVSVLTDEMVIQMRDKRKETGSQYAHIAREFGINYEVAISAMKGLTFKHLPL